MKFKLWSPSLTWAFHMALGGALRMFTWSYVFVKTAKMRYVNFKQLILLFLCTPNSPPFASPFV